MFSFASPEVGEIPTMLNSAALSAKQFTLKKSQIIAKLKKEAEENVLKEKVLASINLPSSPVTPKELSAHGKVRRLPPQQCVILKPMPHSESSESDKNFEENKETPPIIIPGNPEKSMKLLQNKEGRDLIRKEIEKHNEHRFSIEDEPTQGSDQGSKENKESATAIILTSLSTLDEQSDISSTKSGVIKVLLSA